MMLFLESSGRQRRLALLAGVMIIASSLLLMVGTTFAWFTDHVTNEGNIIKAADVFTPANVVPNALPEASDLPAPLEAQLGEEVPEPDLSQGYDPTDETLQPQDENLEAGSNPPGNTSTPVPDAAESPPAADR